MEDQAIHGVRWTFLAYALTRAVGVMSTFVLARLLVPDDFGVMALATAAIGLVGYFTGLGLGPAFIVRQDVDGDDLRTVFSLFVLTNVVTAVAVAALAPAIGSVLHSRDTVPVVLALAVPSLFGGVTLFYESLLQRELEFRPLFVARAAQMALSVVVSIVLAIAGAGVWSLVGGRIAGDVALLVVLVSRSSRHVRPTWRGSVAASLMRSGRGFILQSVFSFIEQNTDYAVVGRTLGAPALGSYSMGFRIGELPYKSVVEPIAQATFPGFARVRERGENPSGAFLSVLRLTALCVVPLGMMMAGAARPAVQTLLGPKWAAVVTVLPFLGLWGAVHAVSGTVGWFVSSMGQAGRLGRAYAALVVCSVPVLVVAVHHIGIRGASLVMVGNAVASLGIGVSIACRHLGVPWRRQWTAVRPAAVAAVPTVLAAAAAARALRQAPPALAFGAALIAAGAAYVGALSIQDPGLLADAARQLRRVVRGEAAPVPAPFDSAGSGPDGAPAGVQPG